MATFMRGKLRWGDQLDEDEVLPPPQISTNGNTKTVTEYYKNERGETMKKTTKSKVVNVEKKVYEVSSTCVLCMQQDRWGACASAAWTVSTINSEKQHRASPCVCFLLL